MKRFSVLFAFALISGTAVASQMIDHMYVNTFGNPQNQALVFVHGGPGYDSWNFELTTAPALAKRGFYVVVYDERGQGRSDVAGFDVYTYKKYADDLKEIIDVLQLKNPVLVGHSHGGLISVQFDRYYPSLAKKIVLVSATVDFGATLKTVAANCATRLGAGGDSANLSELSKAYYQTFVDPNSTLDQKSAGIDTMFNLGMTVCHLYAPAQLTDQAKALYVQLMKNPVQGEHNENADRAGNGFMQNEPFLNLNVFDYVANHKDRFCGIYGVEDGLFSDLDRAMYADFLRPAFRQIAGASHNVFMDQQDLFFEALENACAVF